MVRDGDIVHERYPKPQTVDYPYASLDKFAHSRTQ